MSFTPYAFRRVALFATIVFGFILVHLGFVMIMLGIFGESDPLPYEVSILLGMLALLAVAAMVVGTVRLYRWRPIEDSPQGAEQNGTAVGSKRP